jgi:hypothetical protein
VRSQQAHQHGPTTAAKPFNFVKSKQRVADHGGGVRPAVARRGRRWTAPQLIRQDDFVQRFLEATGNARSLITDPKGFSFGISVNDQSLTPGNYPHLVTTRYADWLNRNV